MSRSSVRDAQIQACRIPSLTEPVTPEPLQPRQQATPVPQFFWTWGQSGGSWPRHKVNQEIVVSKRVGRTPSTTKERGKKEDDDTQHPKTTQTPNPEPQRSTEANRELHHTTRGRRPPISAERGGAGTNRDHVCREVPEYRRYSLGLKCADMTARDDPRCLLTM